MARSRAPTISRRIFGAWRWGSLISGWPALHGWLTERREAEQTRRRLEDKAKEWVRLGRGSGGLLDEVELLEAERWLASLDAADLGYDEELPALVQASRAHIQAERALSRRRTRNTMAGLAIGLLLVTGLAIWGGLSAQQASREATNARNAEATAEARRVEAEGERNQAQQQARIATARELTAQAQAVREPFRQRSLLLAVEAVSITLRADDPSVPAAEEALREVLASSGGRGLSGHEAPINAVAISADSHWLVTGGRDGTARVWDLTASDPAPTAHVL